MKDRIPNILRAAVILIVLTVWLPTAAVLVAPHDNDWVERTLDMVRLKETCPSDYTKFWDMQSIEQGVIQKRAKNPLYGLENHRSLCFRFFNERGENKLVWEMKMDYVSRVTTSEVDWDGWLIYGPITFGLLAGLYFMTGSLSLRPQRLQEAEQ